MRRSLCSFYASRLYIFPLLYRNKTGLPFLLPDAEDVLDVAADDDEDDDDEAEDAVK